MHTTHPVLYGMSDCRPIDVNLLDNKTDSYIIAMVIAYGKIDF